MGQKSLMLVKKPEKARSRSLLLVKKPEEPQKGSKVSLLVKQENFAQKRSPTLLVKAKSTSQQQKTLPIVMMKPTSTQETRPQRKRSLLLVKQPERTGSNSRSQSLLLVKTEDLNNTEPKPIFLKKRRRSSNPVLLMKVPNSHAPTRSHA